LYDMHIDRIYRHVYYRVNSTEDAEDITQQVFIRAWQAIGRFKKTSSPFAAWLMTISHNLIVDYYRSRKDEKSLDSEQLVIESPENPEKMAEMAINQQQIRKVIARLPGDQQQAILMSFIEGFSYGEIAGALGKSEGALRVIIHRALKKMRQLLEAENGTQ
ncbi:RNA polymerase sigma factor, partial [Chloroflexota bacterium]